MTFSSSSYTRISTVAAFLALSNTNVSAFTPAAMNQPTTRRIGDISTPIVGTTFTLPPLSVLSEEQATHTAERLSGMSRGEIQHIFEDVDQDGSGSIDLAELDLLAKYFPGESFTPEMRKKLMKEIDTDGSGDIDAEEFYQWMVVNAKSEGMGNEEGGKHIKLREERLEVGKEGMPQHLMDLLEELGVGAVVQKVTHPLHSAFGRTLYDHFVSCYLISKEWGNPDFVAVANLFHALYQRGDGMQAVSFKEYRPILQEKLGEDVEQLIYLFPSSHKSALLADGLLMAPLGEDIEVPNVLEGGMVTIPKELRGYLVDMEVINSHDQHVLENSDPVHNLWSFYQHVTVLPIMSERAKESIVEYQKRSQGATVADVLAWHEGRFKDAGQEIPELWKHHLDLFRAPAGKFCCAEQNLNKLADKDGDGNVDWEEWTSVNLEECDIFA